MLNGIITMAYTGLKQEGQGPVMGLQHTQQRNSILTDCVAT